jgi:hypothetical protein
MVRAIIVLVAWLMCSQVFAARSVIMTGEELHKVCQTDQATCTGFITGVADALEAISWPAPHTCRPSAVKLHRIVDLVVKYLADNPARHDEPAFDLVYDAQVAVWPC